MTTITQTATISQVEPARAEGATLAGPVIRVEDVHKYYDLGENKVHAWDTKPCARLPG